MDMLKKYFPILIKHVAPVGLFILLPLLVSLYLGHNIIIQEKEKHISKVSTKIENYLKDIESEITPESFLLKVARGAWVTLNEREQNHFWNYYQNLCSFLQSEPDLYVFNDKGSLITPQNINLKSKFLAAKLWNILDASYEEKSSFAYKYKKQFNSFLGKEFKLGTFIDNRNRLMPIIVNTQTGYLYWMNSPENPKKGILLIFWSIPSFEFRFNQVIKRYSLKFETCFIRYFSGEIETFTEKKQKFNHDDIYLKSVLMDPRDGYIDSNGLLWKSLKLEDLWLIGSLQSNALTYDNYHIIFISIVSALGIIIISAYIWIINKSNYYFSIKTKLITLFLIAVFTPVMGFSFLGYQYLSYMRENLISEFGKESRDLLLNIDRELGSSGNVFRNDFREMVKDFQYYDKDEKIRKKFANYLETFDLAAIERRLASDASPINHLTNNVTFEGMNVVTDPFSKCCIDTMFNTNLMDTVDPALRNAMTSPEIGMALFWNSPDDVKNFVFGDIDFYLYWCISQTPQYGNEYYFVLRVTDNVLRDHLRKRLEECKNNPKERDYKIFACNDKKSEWFPDNSIASSLKDVTRRLNFMGKPIETEINIKSKKYLLLGLKSGKLTGYNLYALYPYKKIEEKLSQARKYIILCILIFIIMAFLIGNRLSETFLYPVKQLENGVRAIKSRNNEFRIEILQKDEFGILAQSFNKMIGNLKEMELAKYIQESLLPKNLPQLEGYQLSFSNRMASAVGGDYFDATLLDENNLCIIIGDVSGHGVASALVMATAKAVLYNGFNRRKNLKELLESLNSVINAYFGKPPVRKMITLFATIINLPTGKAEFIDAGHNFPFKISVDRQITPIMMAELPIGIVKKFKIQSSNEFSLEKGETIVFYTDGIVEATDRTEEQYGYDRFTDSLSTMGNLDAENIIKNLFERYEKWKDGTEPDDDVTLAVLKRL